MTPQLLHSPLYDRHEALGAKLAAFGGWQMPLEYPGGGVIKEHTAVRETVGVFDVSHLGTVRVRGSGAAQYVNASLTGDLGRISPGRAQYTICCDDATGGVVDDLIAYLRGDDEVLLLPNAANAAEVVRRLADAAPAGLAVEDLHTGYALIAVQGPRCDEVLDAVGLPAGHAYMSYADADWRGQPVVVARTGYTGERGYELLVEAPPAGDLWDAVLAATREREGLPCGLGARDTLRTEMGYPLHGQDIGLDVTPVQAQLSWAVGWRKPAFWGREVLLAEREAGADRLLWGVEAKDRAIPRPGMAITTPEDRPAGRITSGTYSPTRRIGIGLALLDRAVSVGDEVRVDVRGRSASMTVVKPPFVPSSVK